MDKHLFVDCIGAINDTNAIGYSFVDTFVSLCFKNKYTLGIGHIITYWNITFPNNKSQRFTFYSDNSIPNLSDIDLDAISLKQTAITSENEVFGTISDKTIINSYEFTAIPINRNTDNGYSLSGRCVILFLSLKGKSKIDNDELSLFHLLLNERIPVTLQQKDFINAHTILGNYSSKKLNPFEKIGESLDALSLKGGHQYEKSGLRHFALWELDLCDESSPILSKTFSRNTYKENCHDKTHILLSNNKKHYLCDFIKLWAKTKDCSHIEYIKFGDVCNTFVDRKYFTDNGLTADNGTIIVGVQQKNINSPFYYVSCFYVKNIMYSVFISTLLFHHYTKSFYNYLAADFRLHQEALEQHMLLHLDSQEHDFYKEVRKHLMSCNEVEDCLIYVRNNKNNLVLKNDDEKYTVDVGMIKLPAKYVSDKQFIKFVNLPTEITTDKSVVDAVNMYHGNGSNIVKSALLIKTFVKSKYESSVILLINNCHKKSCDSVYYNNVLSFDNYIKSRFSGLFFYQYQRLMDINNNKTYLLRKLRHEIPGCVNAIKNGVTQVSQLVDIRPLNKPNIATILKNVMLNNSRIAMLADFFSAADFSTERLSKNKTEINLNTFLNSWIEIFRTEGGYRGVDVYFSIKTENPILRVSNFYQLAIANIITNAIRYAYNGTCVNVDVFDDRIEISDIGIPIEDDDNNKIFEEGYRGRKAQDVNEKGMGYGLFLTKRVLDAHKSSISFECYKLSEENYYTEVALLEYMKKFDSIEKRDDFLFKDVDDANRPFVLKYYERMKNNAKYISDLRFVNFKDSSMKSWIEYSSSYNYLFQDMAEELFDLETYKVIFTIKF